jgi:hypothetical protein
MRRWKLLGMVAVTLAAVAVGAFVFWPRSDRITEENYERIFRENMSRAEVESLLGPPGDYCTGPGEYFQPFKIVSAVEEESGFWLSDETADRISFFDQARGKNSATWAFWVGDTGEITIWASSDGSIEREFTKRRKLPQGPIDQLRWQMERLWHRWKPSGATEPGANGA